MNSTCRGQRGAAEWGAAAAACLVGVGAALAPARLAAQSTFLLNAPGSPFDGFSVDVYHVDPAGSLIAPPSAPAVPTFTAPAIFSAPLPAGSGARALGQAGAFTAVADDATAASWNPGGLVQLERPEVSFVFRARRETDRHDSSDPGYRTDDDTFDSVALNYLSAVLPFRIFDRNAVCSLNYQEVFDFTQEFHANFASRRVTTDRLTQSADYDNHANPDVQHYGDVMGANYWNLDVTEYLTTHKTTTLDQVLTTAMRGHMDYEQEGSVEALSPAMALELTPRVSFGMALNVYSEGLLNTAGIHTRTTARYTGTADSVVTITDNRATTGTYDWTGEWVTPPFMNWSGSGTGEPIPGFTNTTVTTTNLSVRYAGAYTLDDRVDDLHGINATLGGLWAVSPQLSLGATLDLPWIAHASETRTVHSDDTVYDSTGTIVLGHTNVSSTATKDVSFRYPLSWTVGGVWHWNDRFSTALDIGQTLWSQYYYQASGEPKRNPLDGSVYGDHRVDDCWNVRLGAEYLWVRQTTEIPLRGGVFWQQQPAIGAPDDYYGFSLGTGFSIGHGPGKVIFDVAYTCTLAQNVMGSLVPGQQGSLATDVVRHEVFASCIVHF